MSTGNNSAVSVIGIEEGINYLQSEFIAKLDDNVIEITNQYSYLSESGTLSSNNIDILVAEIKSKVTKLQSDYDTLADNLKKRMSQSSESIAQSTSNIEGTLSNG